MPLNYGTLRTRILADGHRPSLTAKAPDFVKFAEEEIAMRLRAAEMVTRASIGEAERIEEGVYSTPAGYLEERKIFRSDGCKLDKKDLGELREFPGSMDVFCFSPISDSEIEFRGVPATDATFDFVYFKRPTDFSADSDQNTLLTKYENLYIALALQALYLFTEDLELAAAQGQLALDTITTINEQGGRNLGGAATAGGYNFCQSGTR